MPIGDRSPGKPVEEIVELVVSGGDGAIRTNKRSGTYKSAANYLAEVSFMVPISCITLSHPQPPVKTPSSFSRPR
jgi:hypothetical protein